jgi:predicted RNA-binding Zn-ribbon protein involved in translation (DUF1610 family)
MSSSSGEGHHSDSEFAKSFACHNCGHPYSAYPPDSSFRYAYLNPCQEKSDDPNHNYKQPYECDNCDFKNELYWCGGHYEIFPVDNRRRTKRR